MPGHETSTERVGGLFTYIVVDGSRFLMLRFSRESREFEGLPVLEPAYAVLEPAYGSRSGVIGGGNLKVFRFLIRSSRFLIRSSES